jgi:hypothetical protein
MPTETSFLDTLLFTLGALLPFLVVVVCAALAFAKR